jgi:hypothetical protein
MKKSEKENIQLNCIDKDNHVYVYDVNYKGMVFTLQFYLKIENETLHLDSLDIEGAGPNTFGNKFRTVITEVAKEFCQEFKTTKIEIRGNKRGAGRTKGKFLNPIKLNFSKTVK